MNILSFSIDILNVNPFSFQGSRVSFEFELEPNQTIASLILKTRTKYKLAKIYGDDTFLFEDDREMNEQLVMYYLDYQKLGPYRAMVGGLQKDDIDCIKFLPLSIPIHEDSFLPEPYNLVMKDIIVKALEIWSKKYSKFRCDFFFEDELNMMDMSLHVKRIHSHGSISE